MIETAIIILHYKNCKLTNQCIRSIRKHTRRWTYHIIVVDNNSPMPFRQTPIESDLTIIRNDDRGSVSGMNFGFYQALYNSPFDFKYIVNFDNDVVCMANWLPPLIEVMERRPNVGIVGGKQWQRDMTSFRSVGADLMGMVHKNQPQVEVPVLWMQGSFHMYRTEMMKRIGLHDTRYKIICSDSDYCIHANDRGWLVIFTPKSSVIHIGNASYTSEPQTCELEDKIQFTQKWLGIKFCSLSKENFHYDLTENMVIEVTYKFNESSTVYKVSGVITRFATKLIAKHFKKKKIVGVEVGSLVGGNARSILRNLPKLAKLYLVDNNKEGHIKILHKNFDDVKNVTIIQNQSVKAAKKFPDQSVDFVYIDANHTYRSVKSDIRAWLPKIKSGGIICGHDYYEHPEYGVVRAVDEMFEGQKIHSDGEDWLVYV